MPKFVKGQSNNPGGRPRGLPAIMQGRVKELAYTADGKEITVAASIKEVRGREDMLAYTRGTPIPMGTDELERRIIELEESFVLGLADSRYRSASILGEGNFTPGRCFEPCPEFGQSVGAEQRQRELQEKVTWLGQHQEYDYHHCYARRIFRPFFRAHGAVHAVGPLLSG